MLVHTPDVQNPEKYPERKREKVYFQNRSDWQGRQHRRLPRAANTLAPPPLVMACRGIVECPTLDQKVVSSMIHGRC